MNDYVAKPVRGEDLEAVLARWQVAQTETSGEWPASPSEGRRSGAASVDLAVLTDLRQLDETGELFTTLITHFLDETPRLQEQMQAALCWTDATALAETAHVLKGFCGNLGAGRMQQLCGELQTLGRANDLTTATTASPGSTRSSLSCVRPCCRSKTGTYPSVLGVIHR